MAAVYNGYVDVNLIAGKLADNIATPGGQVKTAIAHFAIGANDTLGSIYRFLKGISSDVVIRAIRINNEAVTGGTNFTIGLCTPLDYDGVGAAINTVAELGSGLDLSGAHAITGAALVADNVVTIAHRADPLWLVAGQAQYPAKSPAFDLCLKAVAMTTGGGGANICVMTEYVQL